MKKQRDIKNNIYVEIEGEGRDLVIFHGWGCNHVHMRLLVTHLSKKYQVMNVNLPGSGESAWSNQDSIDEIADSLLDILPKNAIYIGWSFGGAVAASIAAHYPERISHFVGITTSPKFVEADNWPGLSEPGFKADFVVHTDEDFSAMLKGFIDAEYSQFEPKPESYNQLDELNKSLKSRDYNVINKGVDIIDATDLREDYKRITCPIDLILGADDGTIPKETHPHIEALNPAIQMHIIEGAQHMPFWTHQDIFFSILDNILGDK